MLNYNRHMETLDHFEKDYDKVLNNTISKKKKKKKKISSRLETWGGGGRSKRKMSIGWQITILKGCEFALYTVSLVVLFGNL